MAFWNTPKRSNILVVIGFLLQWSPVYAVLVTANFQTLNGSNGLVVRAPEYAYLRVDCGDVNGDGIDDFIIGTGYSSEGRVLVVFGKKGGYEDASLYLDSLDGTNGFSIEGTPFSMDNSDLLLKNQLGSVVSTGDVNGDGFDDVLIGATDDRYNGASTGRVYVVFGKRSGFEASFNVRDLNGDNGFIINGSPKSNWRDAGSGAQLNSGDHNGDGIDDIVINYSALSGYAIVFGTKNGFEPSIDISDLDGNNGFVLTDFEAFSPASGDFNGDGIDDIAVGDGSIGEVKVFFGKKEGILPSLSALSLNGNDGFTIKGTYGVGGFQYQRSICSGDVNGDGIDDIIIGWYRPFVIFGKTTNFESIFDLSTIDGSNGFEITGNAEGAVASGDVNGDGFDDIILGAYYSYTRPISVVLGKANGFEASIDGADLDGSNGFAIAGTNMNMNDSIGYHVSSGDVNGDGINDIIVGSRGGKAYIVYGEKMEDHDLDSIPDKLDNCPFTSNSDQADANGDGEGDACEPIANPYPYSRPIGEGITLGAQCGGYGIHGVTATNRVTTLGGEVVESDLQGSTTAGVYDVCVICRNSQASSDESCIYNVLYDPNGNFVSGAGVVNSPAGTYISSPDLAVEARFGFIAKRKQETSIPEGEIAFSLDAYDFEFKSVAYEWLVTPGGGMAKLKGEGMVNGKGSYGFILTIQDKSDPGYDDTFRMKIWKKTADNLVIYDNEPTADDKSYHGTTLGSYSGDIQVHVTDVIC